MTSTSTSRWASQIQIGRSVIAELTELTNWPLVLVPQGLLDLMIAEEEELKKRLVKSIDACRKELFNLCSELQLPAFEVQSQFRTCGVITFTCLDWLSGFLCRRRTAALCCRWRKTAAHAWRWWRSTRSKGWRSLKASSAKTVSCVTLCAPRLSALTTTLSHPWSNWSRIRPTLMIWPKRRFYWLYLVSFLLTYL